MPNHKQLTHHEKLSRKKLEEIKSQLMLIAADYDETLRSRVYPDFTDILAIDLIKKILRRCPLIITSARSATAIKLFLPIFEKPIKSPYHRFFLGGGNGRMLYELTNGHLKQMYDHGLTVEDAKSILELYDDVILKHLNIKTDEFLPKGLETYRSIISQNWDAIIPVAIFEQCLKYEGRIFTEKAKVGLVRALDNRRNRALIYHLSASLDRKYSNKFQLIEGDIDIHIVKKLPEDGKVTAVKTVIDLLQIKSEQIATFGDSPEGNDQEFLTSFPFSFTNAVDYCQKKADFTKTPFLLPKAYHSPIGCVYKAIDFLLQ